MLKLFVEGRIKLMEKRDQWVDYQDKAKGKIPSYNYYIQAEDEKGESDVFQLRSQEDFSKLVDRTAVFTIGYYSFTDDKGTIRSGLKLISARSAEA